MINILGYHYTLVTNMTRDELGALGKCDLKKQCLYVAADMTREAQISTLLHEIIEAIDMHLELNIKEHHVICGLETGLFQVLQTNGVPLDTLLTPMGETTNEEETVPTRKKENRTAR